MDELEERIFKAMWEQVDLFPIEMRDQVLRASVRAALAARNYFEPMLDAAVDAIVKPKKQLGDRRLT